MIDWPAIVSIVTIIVGGIVTLGTLYIRSELASLQKELRDLRATLASTHALLMGQHDPIMALEGVLGVLKSQKHSAEFDTASPEASEQRFPRVAEEPYTAMPPYRSVKK